MTYFKVRQKKKNNPKTTLRHHWHKMKQSELPLSCKSRSSFHYCWIFICRLGGRSTIQIKKERVAGSVETRTRDDAAVFLYVAMFQYNGVDHGERTCEWKETLLTHQKAWRQCWQSSKKPESWVCQLTMIETVLDFPVLQ